jgi:multidrug resistance efflux pump
VIQIALIALLVLFVYHVIADRLTPYTAQASVDTPFAQVAPQVSGQVIAVEVRDNAPTRKGQVLFRIDPQPFEIALRTAEANLAVAIQGADVSELDVAYAKADLEKQRIELATNNKLGRIVLNLWEKQAVSETTAIRARSAMDTTSADVTRAEVQLERARSALGETGDNNAKVKQARAAVEQAKLDLHNTTVLAPADGVITNLRLSTGQFVSRGAPVLTFIEHGRRWVTAAMRENQLGNIDPGDEVVVAFDELPGRLFKGHVDSLGWGVTKGNEVPTGQLPDLAAPSGWLREPQQFPVRIVVDPVDDHEAAPPLGRSGAQANVVVLAEKGSIFNPIARLWMRAITLLSYLR